MCRICIQPELYDALYEFARARELLRTTDIHYRTFVSEYIIPVFGKRVSYKHVSNCLSYHIRPALKREAVIYELEHARREGRAPLVRDIDDFCLGREPRSDFHSMDHESWTEKNARPSDLDVEKIPVDQLTEEDIRLYGIEKTLQDTESDAGVTHYQLVYWSNALTQDRCDPEQENDEH